MDSNNSVLRMGLFVLFSWEKAVKVLHSIFPSIDRWMDGWMVTVKFFIAAAAVQLQWPTDDWRTGNCSRPVKGKLISAVINFDNVRQTKKGITTTRVFSSAVMFLLLPYSEFFAIPHNSADGSVTVRSDRIESLFNRLHLRSIFCLFPFILGS